MTEEQTTCYECKQPLKNGEFVGVDGKKVYHHIGEFGQASIPIGCSMKPVTRGKTMSFDLGVFYKGKTYLLGELKKLKNVGELKIQSIDETSKCSKILGNLEGLADAQPCFS